MLFEGASSNVIFQFKPSQKNLFSAMLRQTGTSMYVHKEANVPPYSLLSARSLKLLKISSFQFSPDSQSHYLAMLLGLFISDQVPVFDPGHLDIGGTLHFRPKN